LGTRAEPKLALHELELAKTSTRLTHSMAVFRPAQQQQNRINEAVQDLEKSQDLNENRAYTAPNFARPGPRRPQREPGQHLIATPACRTGASSKPAAPSAPTTRIILRHLFLANSYDELRDPNRINLRYETPAEVEYLVANLLAPVGAGRSRRPFPKTNMAVCSSATASASAPRPISQPRRWSERGAQYGTFDNTAYSLEAFYRTDPGNGRTPILKNATCD